METVIEIEKTNNGYIITEETTGIKKVAIYAVDVSKIVANDLIECFESMKDGEVKSIEFDIKKVEL